MGRCLRDILSEEATGKGSGDRRSGFVAHMGFLHGGLRSRYLWVLSPCKLYDPLGQSLCVFNLDSLCISGLKGFLGLSLPSNWDSVISLPLACNIVMSVSSP